MQSTYLDKTQNYTRKLISIVLHDEFSPWFYIILQSFGGLEMAPRCVVVLAFSL